MILDIELCIEFPIPSVVKLLVIVADNDSGNPKSTNDELLCEVTDVFLGDLCHWFSLYPLGEVVDGYH